jgi:acyl-[acyl-carrier-protein]-phospholipid O-acyltransferase/long-chain-fatty-acid--[acyl-carrier-protein] ligase
MKPAGSYRSLLIQPPFIAYLTTLFITAFNDNAFKIIIMLIALQTKESGYVDIYYIAAQLVFILPFFIFSGYSGYFADKFSKNKVIIFTKILEIIIMLIAVYFLANEHKPMLIFILFLLSTQSVFLSPAKYGILPEWFSEEDISRANGLVELLTFIAIIFGSVAGGILMHTFGDDLLLVGIILLLLAIIGLVCSILIKQVPESGSNRPWSYNPWHEIKFGFQVIWNNRLLGTVIMGISFFFAIALAVTTNLLVFGKEIFSLTDMQLGFLNAAVGIGIGTGSIAAGWLSGDKIEFGLIPLGTIGMTVMLFCISYTTVSVLNLYLLLIALGIFSGLFIVPLNSLLQELPSSQEKGRLIATNNFFNGAFMIIAVLIIWFLQGALKLSPDNIMYVFAWITLFFSIIALSFNPRFFVRFILWLVIHIFYRVDIIGRPNIPKKGAALIVSNHVSYIDGLIISVVLPRFVRYLVHKNYYSHPLLHNLMRFGYAIPIESGDDEKVTASINRAREALLAGHVVCIFAEGRLTRTGNLLPFRAGLERIVEGLDVPIIPIHLDQLWESIFSPRKKQQLFRLPQQFPARVTVTLGDPMPATSKAWEVRQAVQELAVQARISGYQREHYLSVEFLKNATNTPNRYCVYDESSLKKYKYSEFSTNVLYIAHKIKKLHPSDQRIALLLPCGYKAVLLNIAIVIAGKSVVNIPNEYSSQDILDLKKLLNISSIYTDNKDMGEGCCDIDKLLSNLDSDSNKAEFFLRKFITVLKYVLPMKYVVQAVGALPKSPESEVTVLVPEKFSKMADRKFIFLSHESIYNNISGFKQILDFNHKDRFGSILNFDNIIAFTLNLWAPLIICNGQIPLDTNIDYNNKVVELYQQRATILIVTCRDLEFYLEQIPANLLAYVRYVFAIDLIDHIDNISAQMKELFERFYDKFGIRIMTGFGMAEVGSIVTLNTPNVRERGMLQRGSKRDSWGHPLPNVAMRGD